ncbi:hypothetical protein R3P38DRAFT_2746647, partial [Favolaschia claudopus]
MALEHAGDWTNATFSFSALSLVACVILSREPLTAETMTSIICYGQEELGMPVLEFLGSVLHWGPGVPLSTLHASFSDYITDPNRSGTKPWFIDINLHSQFLATRCFQVLAHKLRFNICNIETSHVLNSDVPDLAERVGTHIPESLKYVSQYWAHHLHATATSPAPIVLDGLKTFASQHFLYWLEVLSLLGHVSGAHEEVEIAQTYAQGKDQALEALLHECIKFIAGFAPAISQSIPHLYISALAMVPHKSVIRQHYGKNWHYRMQFEGASAENWSNLLKLFPGQRGIVTSVAFSHDSARVICGSDDCTLHMVDSQTGAVVGVPFQG